MVDFRPERQFRPVSAVHPQQLTKKRPIPGFFAPQIGILGRFLL
jgi:hypothetical protein